MTTFAPAGRSRRTRNATSLLTTRRDTLFLWACIVPAMLVVLVLQVYPLADASVLSFLDWSMATSAEPGKFIGFGNYEKILGDPVFWSAVRVSATVTLAGVAIQLVLGTGIAALLRPGRRVHRIARAVLVLPMVIAPVAAANIWKLMFNSQSGSVNVALGALGIHGPQWLADPVWSVVAIIIVDVWQWTPFVILVMGAAMLSIPQDLVEAASVDGAGRWRTFARIELPLLTGAIALVVTFRVLDSLLQLDTVYALTQGGPGYATYTLTYYLYALGLRDFEIGQSAAGSWLFMIVVTLIIVVMFRIDRRSQRSFE
ncbi:carbohydrate ABC transporter permease [Microbacterium luticocti]|uniref:carbohydrate ABC transporter permease n=1 Tax=Microbacterium luticocti TaxID=451764 RepID=UPI00040ECBD4|nr:sugar ABC transporter permease [Microbacterium luticocti]